MQDEKMLREQKKADFFPVKEVDYLEIYSGNAKQSCHYFCTAFGFKPVAYSGLETGNRETVSYVLQQRKIRLVITGTLNDSSRVSNFIKKHGDGVKDIALAVDDVETAYNAAVERGAIEIQPPFEIKDEHGTVKKQLLVHMGIQFTHLSNEMTIKGYLCLALSLIKLKFHLKMPVLSESTMWLET